MQSEVRWAAKLDIKLVPAGEMLSPKDNMDALAATCAAVRSATNEVGFYHSRQQLLVFDENDEDEDTARRYAAALAREMCSPHPVTQVNLPASKKQVEEAVRKAFARPNSVLIDCRKLAGPRPTHRQATPRRAQPAPIPVLRTAGDESEEDPLDVELAIEEEMGGGAPPPDDWV